MYNVASKKSAAIISYAVAKKQKKTQKVNTDLVKETKILLN